MQISFRCPNGHGLKVAAKFAGKIAKCPKCDVKLKVPSPNRASDPGEKGPPTSVAQSVASPTPPTANPATTLGDTPAFVEQTGPADSRSGTGATMANAEPSPEMNTPPASDSLFDNLDFGGGSLPDFDESPVPPTPGFALPAATPVANSQPVKAASSNNEEDTTKTNRSISPQQILIGSIVAGSLLLLLLTTVAGFYLFRSSRKVADANGTANVTADVMPSESTSVSRVGDARGSADPDSDALHGNQSVTSSDENLRSSNIQLQSVPHKVHRTAPVSDSPGFKLLEPADYFAMNTSTGELAAVQRDSQNLYVYSSQYLATGSGDVIGPIDVGRAPGPVTFKRYKDRGYYLIADLNDPFIRSFDAQTLNVVDTFRTPARHNTSICTSPDPDDPRFYFCTNPYSPLERGNEYFVCAADISNPQKIKIAFQSRNHDPTHCYVSPKRGFLYARDGEYVKPIYLEQEPLSSLTISGEAGSITKRITHQGLVIDPNGAGVAIRYSLLSSDMHTEFQKYDFVVQCFLADRPYVAGFNFNRDDNQDDNRENITTLSLKIAGLDSPKVVHDIVTGFTEIPSGIIWQNIHERWKFLCDALVFHSQPIDSIVMAYRDTVFTIGLGDLDLPTGPSPLPVVDYPSRVRVLTPMVVPMEVPADPNATFTLSNAPEGAVVKDNVLTWTPTTTQIGLNALMLHWTSRDRSGDLPISIYVDNADGAIASVNLAPEILKIAQSLSKTSSAQTLDHESNAPTSPAGTKVYRASFPIDKVVGSWDEKLALCLGWDTRGQPSDRPVDVVSHCAVVDLNTGKINAQADVRMNVVDAAIDDHYVYLKGRGQGMGSPVMVLSRHDLSHQKDLFCRNTSDFGTFAGRILVSTNIYTVPDLRIIRDRERPLRAPFERITPVVLQNRMRSFYRQTADGYVINGVQFDESFRNPKMAFAVDLFASLQFANQKDTVVNPYPSDIHPMSPIRFTTTYSGKLATLSVYAEDRKSNILLKEFPLGLHRNRSLSALDIQADHVLAPVGGDLYRVNITAIRDAELAKHPRFLNQQDQFLAVLDRPATFQYKIQGGTPPYQSVPVADNPEGDKLVIDGGDAQFKTTFSEWDKSLSKSLISNETQKRRQLATHQRSWTGFPVPHYDNIQNEVVDALIKELAEFCTNRLKMKIPRGIVPVPRRVVLKAKDSSGEEFETVHYVFVAVKESEFRDEFSRKR